MPVTRSSVEGRKEAAPTTGAAPRGPVGAKGSLQLRPWHTFQEGPRLLGQLQGAEKTGGTERRSDSQP